VNNPKDLTPEDILTMPPEMLIQLLPARLRNRPTTNPELAYWYMTSQSGSGGHLPCTAGSDCPACPETHRGMHEGHRFPIADFEDPDLEVEAQVLIRDWYRAGAASVAPDDDLFSPFQPELLP
jgi:hypothetical protein